MFEQRGVRSRLHQFSYAKHFGWILENIHRLKPQTNSHSSRGFAAYYSVFPPPKLLTTREQNRQPHRLQNEMQFEGGGGVEGGRGILNKKKIA